MTVLKNSQRERHPDWYYPVNNMRTLILGTFPPHIKQWDYHFYYPNKDNRFWKALAEVGKVKLTKWENEPAVEERKQLMVKMQVGVQNIGLIVGRLGESALDEHISILEYQDILSIIDGHDSLQRILLTGYSGKTSTYSSFIKYLKIYGISHTKPAKVKAGFEFVINHKRTIRCLIGNSTSPTSQRRGVTLEKLIEQFRAAIEG